MTFSGQFLEHVWASLARLFVALLGAAGLTLIFSIGAGLNEHIRRFMGALIGFLYPIPKSAVLPLLLLVFGIDGTAQIFLTMVGGATLMLATVFAGLNRLEASGYLEISRILQLNRRTKVFRVLLPGLMPEFMHGFKLGASYAIVLLIVSEMIATQLGVGVLLWASWDQFKILDLYAMLYLICGTGFVVFGLFDFIGERFADSQRSV
jgi:NitT/TauT family transport system permease protein